MKKVPKTTYCCEEEDFCIGDRSKKCGWSCEVDCHGCKQYKEIRTPCGATMFSRRKLKKVVTEKEEPVYIWVVECMCDHCAAKAAKSDQATAEAALRESSTSKPTTVAESLPASTRPSDRLDETKSLIRRAGAVVEAPRAATRFARSTSKTPPVSARQPDRLSK